jgi:hypothetical protein
VNQDLNTISEASLWPRLEPLLLRVERPSRYIGGEWNAPDITEGGTTVVLAYPDVYEIGTSNLGLAILREVVNDMEGASAERTYSPWLDMESEMRAAGVPLFSLETHRPVGGFDIFGISIPHELTFTNILNLIDLAGIRLPSSSTCSSWAKARKRSGLSSRLSPAAKPRGGRADASWKRPPDCPAHTGRAITNRPTPTTAG